MPLVTGASHRESRKTTSPPSSLLPFSRPEHCWAIADPSLAQPQPGNAAPTLRLARGEDGKVTLAFTAVAGAKEYAVRVVADDGKSEIIATSRSPTTRFTA